ncbi:hypothetical protein GCM10007183_00150 [Staphylococcus muscae]|uniref:Uncharacterized protein n=1 Tax=Staphylococcus muscae TaxID=1294 RepID=A0ABQ1HK62_9STAP|nr:hypothetical protein GCM10007183_00150 [Staphylococcus muscae]
MRLRKNRIIQIVTKDGVDLKTLKELRVDYKLTEENQEELFVF